VAVSRRVRNLLVPAVCLFRLVWCVYPTTLPIESHPATPRAVEATQSADPSGILTPQPAICTDWQTKPPILAREFMLLFLPVRSSSSFPIAYRLCWLSHSAIDKCTADWLASEWQLYGRIFQKYNFT